MKIKIIALGKIKEKFLKDGIEEFLKRLTPYATIEQLNDLDSKVGNEPVSTQINNALANFSSGKTLAEHLTEEDLVLVLEKHYGTTLPSPGTPGRIFFLKVSE